MISQPYEIGRFVYLPNRYVVCFTIVMRGDVLGSADALMHILEVFRENEISLIHMKATRPIPGRPLVVMVFADFTGREHEVEIVRDQIMEMNGVEKVYVTMPLFRGLTVEDVLFPLMLFDERVVIFPRTFYEVMVKRLMEIFKSGYIAMLYYIGFEIGKELFKSHVKIVGHDVEKLSTLCEVFFRVLGYGILHIIDIDFRGRRATVRIIDSFECMMHGDSKRPSSHFIRGILAGWFSELFEEKVKAVEVKCIAQGHEYCEFRVLPES